MCLISLKQEQFNSPVQPGQPNTSSAPQFGFRQGILGSFWTADIIIIGWDLYNAIKSYRMKYAYILYQYIQYLSESKIRKSNLAFVAFFTIESKICKLEL